MLVVVLNLRHRDEARTLRIEHVDDLCEISEAAREPVDLVDDDDVDLPGRDIRHELYQPGSLHVAAGESAIIV